MPNPEQHLPWVGPDYGTFKGQRIAFVGFSHWGDPTEETPEFTQRIVSDWANVYEARPFAERIRGYAGSDDPLTFWNSVAFFNTLPTLVGNGDNRYAGGSADQIAQVKDRVLGIIEAIKPDRVFIMSKKAWKIWPDYTGSYRNGTLAIPDIGEFDCGGYQHSTGETLAFGFPHPQFSRTATMTMAFEAALSFDPTVENGTR